MDAIFGPRPHILWRKHAWNSPNVFFIKYAVGLFRRFLVVYSYKCTASKIHGHALGNQVNWFRLINTSINTILSLIRWAEKFVWKQFFLGKIGFYYSYRLRGRYTDYSDVPTFRVPFLEFDKQNTNFSAQLLLLLIKKKITPINCY